jgi:hypothetical protein
MALIRRSVLLLLLTFLAACVTTTVGAKTPNRRPGGRQNAQKMFREASAAGDGEGSDAGESEAGGH